MRARCGRGRFRPDRRVDRTRKDSIRMSNAAWAVFLLLSGPLCAHTNSPPEYPLVLTVRSAHVSKNKSVTTTDLVGILSEVLEETNTSVLQCSSFEYRARRQREYLPCSLRLQGKGNVSRSRVGLCTRSRKKQYARIQVRRAGFKLSHHRLLTLF
jgi:hypothetical protein